MGAVAAVPIDPALEAVDRFNIVVVILEIVARQVGICAQARALRSRRWRWWRRSRRALPGGRSRRALPGGRSRRASTVWPKYDVAFRCALLSSIPCALPHPSLLPLPCQPFAPSTFLIAVSRQRRGGRLGPDFPCARALENVEEVAPPSSYLPSPGAIGLLTRQRLRGRK